MKLASNLVCPDPGRPRYVPSASLVLAILAGYFCLQVVSRTLISPSMDLDESEAVVLAQEFSLGYGSAPPLYTWLQRGMFSVLGETVLALSLLKNLLLFCTYLFLYRAARRVTGSPAAAVAACLSLAFLPTVSWESQRDLTHSVLASTLSAATLLSFLRVLEARRLGDYVWLGICAGLGALAKFNYVLWLAGLLVAAFTLKDARGAILNPRLLVSLGISLLIFAPSGWWMMEHLDLTFGNVSKLQVRQELPWIGASVLGLKRIALSVLGVGGLLSVIYAVVFFRARRTLPQTGSILYRNLLIRAWLIVLTILILVVVFGKVTTFRERWFQPILVALPVLAASLAQPRLTPGRLKALCMLALAILSGVTLVLSARVLMAERIGRDIALTHPYARIAAQLEPHLPPGVLLVCDTRLMAGNLHLNRPGLRTASPDLMWLLDKPGVPVFLVWDATRTSEMPPHLKAWASENAARIMEGAQAIYLSATCYHHSAKTFRVGIIGLRHGE